MTTGASARDVDDIGNQRERAPCESAAARLFTRMAGIEQRHRRARRARAARRPLRPQDPLR